MASHIERAIDSAAADIADALMAKAAPNRRQAAHNFLVMALWSAAAAAEDLASSAWIDKSKDDGWVKKADKREFPIPDSISDAQFRKIVELMGLPVPKLRNMLGAQVASKPELADEANRILGTGQSDAPALMDKPEPSTVLPTEDKPKAVPTPVFMDAPAGPAVPPKPVGGPDVPPKEDAPPLSGRVETDKQSDFDREHK